MNISKYFIVLLTAAILHWFCVSSISYAAQGEGTLEWKNYVIRLDRGWDILCEPYKVQPNDWVLKIFSKKGEIAHQDFREFLGIFKRLNPHVKDIDRIRPGQIIDIPLKKLTQGTLSGQSSGIVTIPFVTLNSVEEVLDDYSTEYTIRPGDCVSIIIAQRFGIYGSDSYSKGLKMFQSLNPQIKNINQIVTGEKIYVPAPSIQDQPWYGKMFDSQGNLTDKIGMSSSDTAPEIPATRRTGDPAARQAPQQTAGDSFSQAAAALEGTLLNKGTYFFPLASGKEFEIDLSRYPILEKKNGKRYLLTREDKIMGEEIELLQTMLPGITIVKVSENQTTDQIIESVAEEPNADPKTTSLNIAEHGMDLWLQAKWIETVESEGDDVPRRICIIPIESPAERTDSSISRYLLQHNIILKEVLANTGGVISAESPSSSTSAKYTIVTSIAAADKKQFVSEFTRAMSWHYSPNVNLSFPYAEIQINAKSNMLSSGQGQERLIDFEELYGDAISAIEKSGLKVIQIKRDDSPAAIVTKLLKGMNTTYTENPTFMGARRLSPYNTAIKIEGFLLNNQKSEKIMLSTKSLNQKVVEFLEATGLQVIMLGQSKLFY